tara:strand:- start:294 stop:899 length:606 start_codon:yes stop_codon:yes gene_type:complete
MKIGIIDYGAGNIKSVSNMLSYLSINSEFISDYKNLKKFEKVILPGVGKFDSAIQNLTKNGFNEELKGFSQDKNNMILGICLGSQLLLDSSEEGIKKGLGIISGKSKLFKNHKDFPVPHMGWNTIKKNDEHMLFNDITEMDRFYFAHSYHLSVNKKNVLASTRYNKFFPSIVFSDNIFGLQFHPEKSLKSGMKIFKNFFKI